MEVSMLGVGWSREAVAYEINRRAQKEDWDHGRYHIGVPLGMS